MMRTGEVVCQPDGLPRGSVSYLWGSPINWCLRRQATTASSSMEAEYIDAAEATWDVICLRSLIGELGLKVGRPKYSPRRQPVRLSLPIPLPIRAPNTSISSITSSASASRWVQLSWSTLRRRCSERTSLPSLSPVRIMQSTSIPPSRNPRDFKDEQKGRKGDGDGDGDGDGVGVGCAQTRRCRGEGLARRRAA